MPNPSETATASPTIHTGQRNTDLAPKRIQTPKTTLRITINRVSTQPPDEAAVPNTIINDGSAKQEKPHFVVRCLANVPSSDLGME
jgi:hypothetical protein